MQLKSTISIVIPVRDSLDTLLDTLVSISGQTVSPNEIIIVDDGSKEPVKTKLGDTSIFIIRLPESQGPATARNVGARSATSAIVLFVDADVLLQPDVVERVRNSMADNPKIAAVQGVYTPKVPADSNLFTRYQNHYYNFAFNAIEADSPALCATFCFAVRRDIFLQIGGFDTDILKPTVEDEAFGYVLEAAGHAILLDKNLRVMHLARYRFKSLISRKFRMSYYQAKSLFRGNRPPLSTLSSKNKTHHSVDTISAVLLSPLLAVTLLCHFPAFLLIAIGYTAANARFWRYLFKVEPPVFASEMLALTWVDQMTIFSGLAAGTIAFLSKRKY